MRDPDIGHVSGGVDFQHHDDVRPIHIFQICLRGEAQAGEFAGAHFAAGAGLNFAGEKPAGDVGDRKRFKITGGDRIPRARIGRRRLCRLRRRHWRKRLRWPGSRFAD